jgi:hypothetical protein
MRARRPIQPLRPSLRTHQVRGADVADIQAPVPLLRQIHRQGRSRVPVLRPGGPLRAQALSELPQDRRRPRLARLSIVRPVAHRAASGHGCSGRCDDRVGYPRAGPSRTSVTDSGRATGPGCTPAALAGRCRARPQVCRPVRRLRFAATCGCPFLHRVRDRSRVAVEQKRGPAPGAEPRLLSVAERHFEPLGRLVAAVAAKARVGR